MLPIAVPVPTFRRSDGRIDQALTSRYAQRIAATWVESIIIAGPAGLGERCTPAERVEQAAVWLEHADKARLLLTCWHPGDHYFAADNGVRPLAMLSAKTASSLTRSIAELPSGAIAYANPRYSESLLTPAVLADLASAGNLPKGIKVSKVSTGQIAELRAVGGNDLQIWHGSSRDIAASLDAGADIVVAPPLAAHAHLWPVPDIGAVQRAVNQIQRGLDHKPDHWSRVSAVTEMARQHLIPEQP